MAKQVQFRRGTTAQMAGFAGAVGEITVDTTKNTVVIHDGVTLGGHPAATADQVTSLSSIVTSTRSNVAILQANAAQQGQAISSLQANAATQAGQIEALQTISNSSAVLDGIASLQGQIEEQTAYIANLEGMIGSLNQQVLALQISVTDLQQRLDAHGI